MTQLIAWLLLAALHTPPTLALFRPALIGRLYGVGAGEASLPLLQHRAALFGVVVLVTAWAAFNPGVRRVASVAAALSMVSFVAVWMVNGAPAALRVIAIADLAGLPVLAFAAWRAYAA